MPLRDSDIPMNVPFTFRNKQPFPLTFIDYTKCVPFAFLKAVSTTVLSEASVSQEQFWRMRGKSDFNFKAVLHHNTCGGKSYSAAAVLNTVANFEGKIAGRKHI